MSSRSTEDAYCGKLRQVQMEADLSKEERKTGSVESLTMMMVADWCKEQQRCKKT